MKNQIEIRHHALRTTFSGIRSYHIMMFRITSATATTAAQKTGFW